VNTNTTKCSNIYVYNQYMNVQIIQNQNTATKTLKCQQKQAAVVCTPQMIVDLPNKSTGVL